MTVKLANNVSGFLNTAITASDTGIVLQSGNGASFPALGAGEYFYATLVSTGNTLEVVKVTARSGDSMTVVRAQDGTSAASFAAGSRLEMRINAQAVLDVVDQVTASQVGFTPVGGIAATDVQAALAELDSEAAKSATLAASGGSALVGFLQAGTGAQARTVQSKLRDVVSVKDFGAVGNGSANDTDAIQDAWNAVKAAGGGVLFFPAGTYLFNVTGLGSDGVAIQGVGANSILCSWDPNDFAVKYNGNSPKGGVFISDVVFRDVVGSKTRHGLYANTANGFPIQNVVFDDHGIGFCANGTYGFRFDKCIFGADYCNVFITSATGANTSITNVAGQTVSITNAYFAQQPGLQLFIDCSFSGQIGVYFEQPDNAFQKESALKFIHGVVQTAKCGVYLNSTTGFHNVSFDNVWFEGSLGTVAIRGLTLPGTYVYSEQFNLNFNNCTIPNVQIAGPTLCTFNECVLPGTYTATGVSAFRGRNCMGDDKNVDFFVEGGRNYREDREFSFITSPKTSLSGAYRDNLVYSNACLAASPALSGWSSIATDGVFETKECFEQSVAASNSVLIKGSITISTNKVYVATFSVKNTNAASANGYITLPGVAYQFIITNKWRHYAAIYTVSAGSSSAQFRYDNTTGSTQNIRLSGFQCLEFDNYDDANAFLASSEFVLV